MEDNEIRFDFLGGFDNVCHNALGVGAVFKMHFHLLGHKRNGSILDAFYFFYGGFHQIGAVGAIHFDFE